MLIIRITCLFLLLLLSTHSTVNAQQPKTSMVYQLRDAESRNNKTPVLIMLHGYGSDDTDLFDLAKGIDKNWMVFSLRAPNKRRDYGYCWYEIQFMPNGEFKYDYEQVKKSKALVLDFIREVCKTYQLDSSRVFLMGFSQGTILSYELAVSNPSLVTGVIGLSGRLLAETRTQLKDKASLQNLRLFIGHGTNDEVIRIKEAEMAKSFFSQNKVVKLDYHEYPMAHSISQEEFNDIRAWLFKMVTP